MWLQVLGPVRAWRDATELDLGPAGQRALLGVMALADGQPLARSELVDALWGERPPASATNVIQTYVKHLRRLLEPARRPHAPSEVLPAVGTGYALRLPEDAVDVSVFRRLLAEAAVGAADARYGASGPGEGGRHGADVTGGQRGDAERTVALLGLALGLWHGPPLPEAAGATGHPRVRALIEEHRAAVLRYASAARGAGVAAQALPILTEVSTAHPFDEAVHAQLMRCYRAAGRRDRAFGVFDGIRRRLRDELGVAPGPELAAARADLLREAPERPASGSEGSQASGGAAAQAIRPAQQPADVPGFVGRIAELSTLDSLLPPPGRDGPDGRTGPVGQGGSRIVVVSGTAGIGKTALAVHWAHRARDRFPDGLLYADLRGYGPDGEAVDPAVVVRGFLDALQVPAHQVPAASDAQAALYRSRLAGRRVLVLLDNARDAGQVRPLLPSSPGCAAVVTSRGALVGLIAAGAQPVTLDLLPAADAWHLLQRRLGSARLAEQSQAAHEIIARCARLPLALAIVAARAVTHPQFSLATLAAELAGGPERLDRLSGPDPAVDVRSVFSWSYRALGRPVARLFRLLGLHTGPDIGVPAAASLGGLTLPEARRLLAELAGAHLLEERVPGRFAAHDLLRDYAAEQAATDSTTRRRAAVRRMLDYYLHTAHAADRLLNPRRDPVQPPAATRAVVSTPLSGYDEAMAWFTAEYLALVSAAGQAAAYGFDAHAWQLAWAAATFLDRRSLWHDWAALQRDAIEAARRLADPAAEAVCRRSLARACIRLGQFDVARDQLHIALDLYRRAGDQTGTGHTEYSLTIVAEREGRHREALEHARRALDLHESTGHRVGQADALAAIGWLQVRLGDHQQALVTCEQALTLHRELEHVVGQAETWDSLGNIHHQLGRYERAVAAYTEAVRLRRGLGDKYYQAASLSRLGETYRAAGDLAAARASWRQALNILDGTQHPEAAAVRARLADLDAAAPSRR
ncbi:AfsR/SARP family transcriptional regulator [Rugosimonospora africana]|uniref:SARP family transcriptional regulator n=1 Tax=Rugosimonospora africana TaxID=556532 RepID=A0A8J3QVB7_9ACTN|nr:tetratricopeptide repeat protein [Rugosimonospora africana]GIH16702.1 SARP family transcriptional regulator [Rugosimonospora africana]